LSKFIEVEKDFFLRKEAIYEAHVEVTPRAAVVVVRYGNEPAYYEYARFPINTAGNAKASEKAVNEARVALSKLLKQAEGL
jgi:hypothetical protein